MTEEMNLSKKSCKKEKKWYLNWELYILAFPALALILTFKYLPMFGLVIAFKDYNSYQGIAGSPWAEPLFKHFSAFFKNPYFWRMILNTLRLSLTSLLFFPLPILFALLLNEIYNKKWKNTVQMISYAPYFVSLVVTMGIFFGFLEANMNRVGIVNKFIGLFGFKPIKFMEQPGWFNWIYVLTGMWNGLGWWSTTYVAALAGVDPCLHEAAQIDGAGKIRRIVHINIPAITPIVSVSLIMQMGNLLDVGFEKVLLMQNELNYSVSNIISTYVYEVTLGSVVKKFSYGTAIGLFNNIIGVIMVLLANFVSKKLGGETFF